MNIEKSVNYTDAQTAELVEAYKASPTVEIINQYAELFDKSPRSIVAKLTHEGVYQAKARNSTTKSQTKAELVASLEASLNLNQGILASLDKATRESLMALDKAVKDLTTA